MHPALSVILFSTLSGLGFGAFAWLGTGRVPDVALLPTALIAFALSVGGLTASTFHLGHPERAWRALSQWRSSWLSREGVAAVVTLALAAMWWLFDYPQALGVAMSVMAFLTVFTTAMIYAQMRSVRTWNTPLTPAVYLLLSLAGGGVVCLCIASFNSKIVAADAVAAGLLLLLAWGTKAIWWRRADGDIELSTPATATGLGQEGQVRLLESPHSGGNYLLSEMGFRIGRRHQRALRRIALVAGAAIPMLMLVIAVEFELIASAVLGLALLSHAVGILAERWLFFAEARHAVMNYYQ
ncbi:MAG: dimethyl sulfoxide reductase anchor subunit [Gammaproteobacteria bacterium]|nr:dimethyl sulfoxide reductase anchor subunit [Gammaproteobacteria bacterium]